MRKYLIWKSTITAETFQLIHISFITIMIPVDNNANQALAEGGRLATKFRKFSGPLDYPAAPLTSFPRSIVTSDLPASHVPFMMQSITHWAVFPGWFLPPIIFVIMNFDFANCEKRLLPSSCLSVCPSVRPHGTTRF